MPKNPKLISTRRDCDKLAQLVRGGKARVVKEIRNGTPEFVVFGAGGSYIGAIQQKWKYIFAGLIEEGGAGDGLFPGLDQTTAKATSAPTTST